MLTTADATSNLMPLHKLSQWLAYSLIEPLQNAGIRVTEIDGLTGLAEYRNGGLFVDNGVLAFRESQKLCSLPEALRRIHRPQSVERCTDIVCTRLAVPRYGATKIDE